VICGRNEEKGKQTIAELKAGRRAAFMKCDVKKQAQLERLIENTVKRFGKVDILVNNAGGAGGFAPVAEMSNEAWQDAMDWNVNSTFWATRKVLQYMLPQQWGRIINISSVEGKHGKPGIAQYVTAKHAINGFTKSVAKELGTAGITINAICPGLVLTDIVMESGAAAAAAMGKTFDEMIQQFSDESAIKRPNTVEEVAALAVLLASPAGAGITGALLSVDGGTAAY
jgi:NAD(P)-dependent dehydrogenase (short-subunit alcohol dehydrogenase family)